MIQLPLKNKIDIVFLIVFILLINIFYINYRSIEFVSESGTMVSHSKEVLFNLENTISQIVDMETGQRGFIITGEKEYLEPLRIASQNISSNLDQLRNLLSAHPQQIQLQDSLSVLIGKLKAIIDKGISIRKEEGMEAAVEFISGGEGKMVMKKIRLLIGSMKDDQMKLLALRTNQRKEFVTESNNYFILLSGLVIALLIVFYFAVRKNAIRLNKVNNKLSMANDELKASEEELRSNLDQISELQGFLQEREKQYRELVEEASDMIYELDERGKFSFTNFQMQSVSGYSHQELLQMNYWDVVAPSHQKKVIDFYRNQLKEKTPTTYLEFPILSQGGHEIWVGQNVRMLFREDGWVTKVSAVARDISQLKHVQSKLEESEKYYRLLSTNSKDLITLYKADDNATRVFVSPSVKEILGYEPEELVGKSPFDILVPEDRKRMLEDTHRTTLSGKSAFVEYRIYKKDGSVIWMESNSHPFFDSDGNISGFQTSARDITQRKQFEFELIEAKEKAEEATKAKSLFLSMMSHEIRTPMNAIIGLTNWLLQKTPRPDQMESLRLLKFSGENLLTIINDILDFSKIEAGKLTLEYTSFDLYDLMSNLKSMLEQRARDKGISLQFAYDTKLPRVVIGDNVRLGQVITNLIGNAIKFTEHGYVEMSVRSGGMKNGKHIIQIKIKDTGIGIPADKIRFIFESFSQAHSSRRFGGTGLGLSISRKLLNLMGSDIEVESSPGYGSTFYFTLLLQESTLKEGETGKSKIDQVKHTEQLSIRVLLVDDNEVNQIVASNFLQQWGAKTDSAYDGQEAVELIKNKSYQLVLMDLHMPEMNGYEAAKEIRGMDDPYFKNIPIIALTASATLDVKERVVESGMNDYLSKPFQPEELYSKICQYTQQKEKVPYLSGVHLENGVTGIDHPDQKLLVKNIFFDPVKFGEHTMDIREVKKETAEAFIAFTPHLLGGIKEAMECSDAQQVAQLIHKLKSSVSIFCVDTLSVEVASLEMEASQAGQTSYNGRILLMIENVTKLMEEVILFLKTA